MTCFQSTSNSSATIMGMEVLTFCPISGLGDMMVTTPFSPIFKNPLILNHSFGISKSCSGLGLQDTNQLNPSIMPPPASTVDLIKERLLYVVLTVVMVDRQFCGFTFNILHFAVRPYFPAAV